MEDSTTKLQPFKDYKMVFYGNNRLAFLMQNSLDPRLRHKNALWLKYEKGTRVRAQFFGLYLYMPKGSNELKVI